MSLAERYKTPNTISRQGLPCSVAELLESLPDVEAKALRKMLAAPFRVWGHQDIEDALLAEGHKVGRGTVGKHRRGSCRCGRAA